MAMTYQRPPDLDFSGLNNALIQISNEKQNERRNKLLDMQISEAEDAINTRNKGKEFSKNYFATKDETQRASIMEQYIATDPKGAAETITMLDKLDEAGAKRVKNNAKKLYSHIMGVMNQDGTLNPEAYNQKAPAYGLPIIDGTNVTAQAIQGQLKTLEMQILGTEEFIKGKFDTENKVKIENKKYSNALSLEDKKQSGRVQLEDVRYGNDAKLVDKKVAGQKEVNAAKPVGMSDMDKQKISAWKSRVNTLTDQLNNTIETDGKGNKGEKQRLQKEINFYNSKIDNFLGESNGNSDTMQDEPEDWEDYLN